VYDRNHRTCSSDCSQSFDAWIVGFGMSKVLMELQLAQAPVAYVYLAVVGSIDI
jgi:hypothetical protein